MLLNYVCYYLEIRKKQLYANKKNKINKEKNENRKRYMIVSKLYPK